MKPEIVFHKGRKDRPACIFIHGLGMDKDIWVEPSKARILGGLFPMSVLIREAVCPHDKLKTLYHDLKDLGYTVITWSQSRPSGPMETAIKELLDIIKFVEELRPDGIILIGHSRGGLIARGVLRAPAILAVQPPAIKAVITISTPHLGSTMAGWAIYLTPLAHLLKPLLKDGKGMLGKAVKRILDFLESEAVRELLPDSDFLKSLGGKKPGGIYFISAGGTYPTLAAISGVFSIPESLKRIFKRLPDEMIKGKGDGLVSLKSSVLSFADEHLTFDVNHSEILVDPVVRETLVKKIESLAK